MADLLTLSASLAADLSGVLNQVGAHVPQPGICLGLGCFDAMAVALVAQAFPLVRVLALIFVTIAGLRLVSKSSEDEVANARRSIMVIIAGVVLAVLTEQGILFDAVKNVENGEGAELLCDEFLGIIQMIELGGGFLAILAVVITGINVLVSFGAEDVAGPMRNAVFALLMGLFILVAKTVVFPAIGIATSGCSLLGTIDSSGLVNHVISLLSDLLGYLEIVAVLIIVILGIMLIINWGNEESFNRLKGYLIRAVIGFIILAMTKLIIDFVFIG